MSEASPRWAPATPRHLPGLIWTCSPRCSARATKLEPGGRIAVNVVAWNGARTARFVGHVNDILQNRLRLVLRGEVICVDEPAAVAPAHEGSGRWPRESATRVGYHGPVVRSCATTSGYNTVGGAGPGRGRPEEVGAEDARQRIPFRTVDMPAVPGPADAASRTSVPGPYLVHGRMPVPVELREQLPSPQGDGGASG